MKRKILNFTFIIFALVGDAQINLTSDLKLCMPFSGNANDFSGNNNNGVVNNATLTADRFGNPNSAYSFGTGTSNINIGNLSIYEPTNELTISIWGKSKVTTSTCLFQVVNDTPHDRFVGAAQYSNGGSTMMYWDHGSIYSGGRTTKTAIPVDIINWHHYVYIVSQSGNKKQMYLDGVLVSNANYIHSVANKNKPILIGAHVDTTGGSLRWLGDIDDITIYNRALNQAEVTALYTATTLCIGNVNTGIDELNELYDFKIFPTFSESGIYEIYNRNSKDFKLDVYSIDGKLIKQYSSKSSAIVDKIDISPSEPGIYIIRIYNEKHSINKKVVKD